jgi:hypothetical protein
VPQSGRWGDTASELRRLFPAVTDTAQARACARTIAGWQPLPVPPRPTLRAIAAEKLAAWAMVPIRHFSAW